MNDQYIKIPLTKGYEAIVDAEDAERVLAFKWCALTTGRKADGSMRVYAYRKFRMDGKQHGVLMHRLIIGAKTGEEVDHKNHDTLDNRRENLRPATRMQNGSNILQPLGKSGYRGVVWHPKARKWTVRAKRDGKNHYFGLFSDKVEAALAYDEAARSFYGEFAVLNFPKEGEGGYR